MAREASTKYQKLTVKDFECETFKLLKSVWNDYMVDLTSAGRRGNTDPAWTQLGSSGLYLPGFSAAADNEVFFDIQAPHGQAHGPQYNADYDRNSQLDDHLGVHVHWMPSTALAGNIVLELTYWVSKRGTAYSDDDVVTVETVVAAPGAITEGITQIGEIPGDDIVDSSVIVCRFRRLGTDTLDTYAGLFLGMSADTHILFDGFGSSNEFGDS
jgi:hypothetical protein